MRLVRYLSEHKLAYLVVVCMFLLQAVCDLALPNYTAKIIDVGISQNGIEDAAPDVLTSYTYELAKTIASETEGSLIDASYVATDTSASQTDAYLYERGYEITQSGKDQREALNTAMALPLVCEYLADQFGVDFSSVYNAYLIGDASREEVVNASREVYNAINQSAISTGQETSTLLNTYAISAAKQEYSNAGVNLYDKQIDYLLYIGGIMLAITAAALIVHCIMNFFACRTACQIARDLRERFFKRVLAFSDAEINKFSAASLITRATNDIAQIQTVSLMMQRMVTYTPIIAVGGLIMVFQTCSNMVWTIGVAIAAILISVIILFSLTMPKFRLMQKLIDRVNLVSREILTGIPVIRAFNRQDVEQQRFDEANTALMKTQLFTNRAMSFLPPVITLVMNGTAVLVVWVGAQFVDLGSVQTGQVVAFITYSMIVISSFMIFGLIAMILPRANVSAKRIDDVIATSSSVQDALEVYDESLSSTSNGVGIEFKDVSFTYPAAEHEESDMPPMPFAKRKTDSLVENTSDESDNAVSVLSHVSFSIAPGSTTAIIGPTGSGKSTIIKLIERFFDVSEGAVLVDGYDVREISQKRLRGLFGYVPQSPFLFTGTIESNVVYGNTDITHSDLDAALEVACAKEFVYEKPDGLASEISQGGTNVSGGQRQRLAIARALATQARGFLFDDSFSALDYKTDAQLRLGLKEKLSGHTVVIVAQRIATIMHADHIIVLDEGCVVGQGTHEELMQSCPTYQEIALSQLSPEELAKGGLSA